LLRTILSLLYRSMLFVLIGATMVVFAQLYGPTLFAGMLPKDMRARQDHVAQMSPQKIIEALEDIRGALE
jgi:hypothetical protein